MERYPEEIEKEKKKKPLVKLLSQFYFDFFSAFKSGLIWKK